MTDYNLVHDKLESIYLEKIISILQNDLTLCNVSADTKTIGCPICEKIFSSEYPTKKVSANITFREKIPFSLEVQWTSPIGFVSGRIANYRLWLNHEDKCKRQ